MDQRDREQGQRQSWDAGTLGNARRARPPRREHEDIDAAAEEARQRRDEDATPDAERGLPEERYRPREGHVGDGRGTGGGLGGPGVRPDPPGTHQDLTPDNSQGFTGEIGDRKRQFPGSEAQKRIVDPDDPERHRH